MQISFQILLSMLLLLSGLFLSFYVLDITISYLISALTLITGLNLSRLISNKPQ